MVQYRLQIIFLAAIFPLFKPVHSVNKPQISGYYLTEKKKKISNLKLVLDGVSLIVIILASGNTKEDAGAGNRSLSPKKAAAEHDTKLPKKTAPAEDDIKALSLSKKTASAGDDIKALSLSKKKVSAAHDIQESKNQEPPDDTKTATVFSSHEDIYSSSGDEEITYYDVAYNESFFPRNKKEELLFARILAQGPPKSKKKFKLFSKKN